MKNTDPALDDGWYVADPERSLSWSREAYHNSRASRALRQYVVMQMAAAELPLDDRAQVGIGLPEGILANLEEKNRLLSQLRAPIDQRIEAFLADHLRDVPLDRPIQMPNSLVLDRHGMARELSLPSDGARFDNDLVSSYRLANGVLHNPRFDRRTTQGTFHVAEGGLPIPGDKLGVPLSVFGHMLQAAVNPPDSLLELPFTFGANPPAKTFVSLLIRPLVCPAVAGYCRYKSMEIRFFAPGSLVSNLDFVESIFGNAGDPMLPTNDSALDVLHWTGHTGCVIVAPHLVHLTKRAVGLPSTKNATHRQRENGMCWDDPNELYNHGQAFKLTCRTAAGVIITLIADNYFGYCKKEVKTQISYAANLLGNVEEEHAGGAIAFASYSLGDEFQFDSQRYNGRTFADVSRDYADFVDVHANGSGTDRFHPEIAYVPESARASLRDQQIRWMHAGIEQSLPLVPGRIYIAPSGYKLHMEKHPSAQSWRLIGTAGEGTTCHKPCTVSGGGKSEISKSLRDYMLGGPIFVGDIDKDFELVDRIFRRDYSDRWRPDSAERPDYHQRESRKVLDSQRTLGSVIKLFTPSKDYTDEYNQWLTTIPTHVYAMAFIIKRFTKPEWNENWQEHFTVDVVNGDDGHELKFQNRKLVGMYLRVGLDSQQRWRTFKLRQDFAPAAKVQLEDDITASVVVPGRFLDSFPDVILEQSYKFVANCEYRLFQRPDDAIHRGLDNQSEKDIAADGNFFCNYEPLTQADVNQERSNVMVFDQYTQPMQDRLNAFLAPNNSTTYVVSSAHPRLVDGKPSKNPRYLQDRIDLTHPLQRYIAVRGLQLFRASPAGHAVPAPVSAILSGRRNNPPDRAAGIRTLAVYNPIHYQELPELLMDYICSLTGKSPSTTGAGSEGALTKGPFNALLPAYDLNALIVSLILTELGGFSTAAGFIGPNVEVGHDISLLVPEIWCRLSPKERDPKFLISEKLLEKVEDFDHNGERIFASRLGYRITARFVRRFFGRVFDNPSKVFDESLLCPEKQDVDSFVDGIRYIVEAHERVAKQYYEDGSVELACPPLKAILSIMATGHWNGLDQHSPEVRRLFSRDSLLASDWYRARLVAKQRVDLNLWRRHVAYLSEYVDRKSHQSVIDRLKLNDRLTEARSRLEYCSTDEYLKRIQGTLGVDPTLAG